MRIRIVQQRAVGQKTEGDGEPSSKRLHETTFGVWFPEAPEVRHLPAFAASPFQRGCQGCVHFRRRHLFTV